MIDKGKTHRNLIRVLRRPGWLMLVACLSSGPWAQAQDRTEAQERAVAELQRLGALIKFDESKPGKPVRAIDFLSDRPPTEATLALLSEFPHLEYVGLHGNVTDAGLARLQGLTSLKRLIFNDVPLSRQGLEHLEHLPRLTDLCMFLNGPSAAVFDDEAMGVIPRLPALRSLLIGCKGLTDTGLKHLEGMNRLHALSISSDQITDAGVAHLKGLTALESLQVSGPRITDAGVAHLKAMTRLRRLNLSDTQITDQGLEPLLRVMKDLQELLLDKTRITDATLERLNGLPLLVLLSVSGTPITDEGINALKGRKALWSLSLDGTRVTEAGLASLRGLTALEHLALDRSLVDSAGAKALQAALPTLKIRHFERP